VAGWEGALGLLLLSGANPLATWLAALTTFVVFLAINIVQSLAGVRTCHCFGGLPVQTWLVGLVDAIVIVALWNFRPSRIEVNARNNTSATRQCRAALVTVRVLAALSMVSGIGVAAIHQPPSARLQVLDWPETACVVEPGSYHMWPIRLRNDSPGTIDVGAVEASCECLTLFLSDTHVPPGETVRGTVVLDLSSHPTRADDVDASIIGWDGSGRGLTFAVRVPIRFNGLH